jgi:hypothetical protein
MDMRERQRVARAYIGQGAARGSSLVIYKANGNESIEPRDLLLAEAIESCCSFGQRC